MGQVAQKTSPVYLLQATDLPGGYVAGTLPDDGCDTLLALGQLFLGVGVEVYRAHPNEDSQVPHLSTSTGVKASRRFPAAFAPSSARQFLLLPISSPFSR